MRRVGYAGALAGRGGDVKKLRAGLPPLPQRMSHLPLDERNYPVPWFVAWVDGVPEFRAFDPAKFNRCVKESRCWVCGERLGQFKCFVIGPMCVANRTTAEPPSHLECAVFSATACPFLTLPKAQRREAGLPDDKQVAGVLIKRNPGVVALWTSRGYTLMKTETGYLIRLLEEPVSVAWYAQGRLASRDEVLASLESGLPILQEAARNDANVEASLEEVRQMYQSAVSRAPA